MIDERGEGAKCRTPKGKGLGRAAWKMALENLGFGFLNRLLGF